jgi:hypothetical protein
LLRFARNDERLGKPHRHREARSAVAISSWPETPVVPEEQIASLRSQ